MILFGGLINFCLKTAGQAPIGICSKHAAWLVEYPLLGYWIMVAFMTLPMIALMRYHRYTERDCAGMTATMLAPLIVLSVPVLLGGWSIHTLQGTGDVAMLLGMAAYMRYQRP